MLRGVAATLILLLVLGFTPLIASSSSTYYRVEVLVFNENPYEVYNYTLKITIPSDHIIWDYLTDDSTVFVTDKEGNPLYYYVEYFNATEKSLKLLVKIPYVRAEGNITIYIWFGGDNPYSNYNDIRKAYLFYDDFNDGIVDWNIGSVIASVKEENGWLELSPTSDHSWDQLEYYKHYWINISEFNISIPFKIHVHQYVWKISYYDLGQCLIALYDPSGERILSLGVVDWDGDYGEGTHIYFMTINETATYEIYLGINHYIDVICKQDSCYFRSYTEYGTVFSKTLAFSGNYKVAYIAITTTKYGSYAPKVHKVDYIVIQAYADTPLSYTLSSEVEEAQLVQDTGGGATDITATISWNQTSTNASITWINVSINIDFGGFGAINKVFYFEDLQWFSITFEPIICSGKVVLEFSSGLDFTNTHYHGSANMTFPDLEGELQKIIRYANGTIDIITSTSTIRIPNFTRKIIVGFPSFWDQSYQTNILELIVLVQDNQGNYGIGIEESIVSISKFNVKITYEDEACIDTISTGSINMSIIPRTIEEYKIPDWYDVPGWFGLIRKLFADFFGFIASLFNAFANFILFVINNPDMIASYAQIFLVVSIVGIAGLSVYNPGLTFNVVYTIIEIAVKVFRLLYNAIMKVAQFIAEMIPF